MTRDEKARTIAEALAMSWPTGHKWPGTREVTPIIWQELKFIDEQERKPRKKRA